MTNEEAIEILYDSLGGRQDGFDDAFNIAIESLQENTKLKAEIDELQSTNAKLCEEIAELKGEK